MNKVEAKCETITIDGIPLSRTEVVFDDKGFAIHVKAFDDGGDVILNQHEGSFTIEAVMLLGYLTTTNNLPT